MAIPAQSLSGTEVLRRECIDAQSTDYTAFRFDTLHPVTGTETYTVPALHIITIISIIFTETADNSEGLHLQGVLSSNTIKLLNDQALAAKDTFVWSDKLVLIGGDKLVVGTTAGANIDIWYTYIDQSWE